MSTTSLGLPAARPREAVFPSTGLPRLTVELVPSTAFCSNLRSILAPQDWDGVRRQRYRIAQYQCEICGGRGPDHPVEAHERWHYQPLVLADGRRQYWQFLTGIWALCPACHEVKHLGYAERTGRLAPAMMHLAEVNDWDPNTTLAYVRQVFSLWRERSQQRWGLDIGWLETQGWSLPTVRWTPDVRTPGIL